MKKLTLTAALTASLLLAACGGAAGGSGAPKGPLSEERSTAFKSFMPTFSGMGKVVKGDDAYHPEQFKAAAAKFAEEAAIPFQFFENDPQGNGDALPPIWEHPEDFQAEQDKFINAVKQLNEAAQTGNLDTIKAAYGEVGASCKSCHTTYRRPK